MPLPEAFTNAVCEWYETNGNVECTTSNGRADLITTYMRVVPRKTKEQANIAVSDYVRKLRPIIAPQRTKSGLKRKAVGANTAQHKDNKKVYRDIWNPINSPINNPINNPVYGPIASARRKADLAASNKAELAANPHTSKHVLSGDELEGVFHDILSTKFTQFGNKTLEQAMDSGRYSVYVGMTRRTLEDEFLGFLGLRNRLGPNGSIRGPRPILMKDQGFKKHFTGKEAINQLGAVGVEIFRSVLRYNVSWMEDRLQTYIKHSLKVKYPQRLFREVAKGKKREDDDTLDGEENSRIHRTFLTIFKIVEKSADWGDDKRCEENKSYPKSVRFMSASGEETTVYIQA